MKIGTKVRLSAIGLRVFSVACRGMATTGVVTGIRDRVPLTETRGRWLHANDADCLGPAIQVKRDGERQGRWFGCGTWWEIAE